MITQHYIRIYHYDLAPSWWRHQMETFSALLAHCEGKPPVSGDEDLCCFLWFAPEQTSEQILKTPVLWDAMALIKASCNMMHFWVTINHQFMQCLTRFITWLLCVGYIVVSTTSVQVLSAHHTMPRNSYRSVVMNCQQHYSLKALRSKQKGRHSADGILKYAFIK